MSKIRWYIGNALAGYWDFCKGILIAALIATAFGKVPSPWLLLWGACMALLPDILDLVWPVLRGYVPKGYDHRTTLAHTPAAMLLGLSIFFVALIDLADKAWVLTAYLSLLWHYAHDAPDGLVWGWPFSWRKFPDRKEKLSHEESLERTWCRASIRSSTEIMAGSLALAVASQFVPGVLSLLCGAVALGTMLFAAAFWSMCGLKAKTA